MKYFTDDYIDFFAELSINNDREWFNANKKRYERSVKEPFAAFTQDMVRELKMIDPDILVDPRKAGYRIYRDVRFSHDKTPYKLHMGFGFGRDKRDYDWPGYTLGIGVENGLSYAGGMYEPSKATLLKVRRSLMDNSSELEELLDGKSFKDAWGVMRGDKNKILPAEFKLAAKENPLLLFKQWIYWKQRDITDILADDLLETVIADFKVAAGFNQYFKRFY